jgi:uncharacterized protein YndB with AHSA1/START domain
VPGDDRIEREVLIDAPIEIVWSVVTEPKHVAGWLSDSVDLDPRPNGRALFTWSDHGDVFGRVERVERPRVFAFRWSVPMREFDTPPELGAQNSTLVEFHLSTDGERTRLRVVESGFASLDAPADEIARTFQSHERGWGQELGDLEEYMLRLQATSTQ